MSHLFDEAGVMPCQLWRELPVLTHCTRQMDAHKTRKHHPHKFQLVWHTQQREAGKGCLEQPGVRGYRVYMTLQANTLPSDLLIGGRWAK